jgi:integrase
MTLELEALVGEIDSKKQNKYLHSLGHRYEVFCMERSYKAYPVVFETLGAFVVDFVMKLNGSAKSIGKVIHAVHLRCLRKGQQYLSELDRIRLASLKKELAYRDVRAIRRVRPLTTVILEEVGEAYMASGGMDDEALLAYVLSSTAHDGLFRGGETCSKLRSKQFRWARDRKNVAVRIKRTKTVQSGPGVDVVLVDYGPNSAVALLREWFTKLDLWDSPDAFVFPAWSARKKCFNRTRSVTTDKLRKYVKSLVSKAGYDPKEFSGHSLRAGGATDLFTSGMSYTAIKKYGRWKSDAALLYYRDELHVQAQVCEAFKGISKQRCIIPLNIFHGALKRVGVLSDRSE